MNRADRRKTAKTSKERIDEYNEAGRQMMMPGGDARQAQSLFRQVLSLDPGDAHANHYLGVMEMWTRNHKKAEELFTRAHNRDPNNSMVTNNLGLALHEQGRLAEAMAAYEEALKSDQNNVEARVNLARGLLQTNQRDRALAEAQKAVTMKPEFGTAQFMLGAIAQEMNEIELARTALQKAVSLIPGHREANFRLCRLGFDPADPEAYLKPSAAAYGANADNASAALTWSELLMGVGKFAEAKEVLEKHVETDALAVKSGILTNLANAYTNLGDYDTATTWHKKAIAANINDPGNRLFYGRTLLQSGDYKAAGEQLWKARQASPFAQDLIAMLMLAQKLAGQTDTDTSKPEDLISVSALEPKEAWSSIEDLNKSLLNDLADIDKQSVHPFDKNRRLANPVWETVLGKQGVESIDCLRDLIQEKIIGYVTDMPDDVDNHPLYGGKKFGPGPSGSFVETAGNFENFSCTIDQQGWFRMIYFINVPKACEDEDKRDGWLNFGVPHFDTVDTVKPDHEIKPVAGQVVIFPAFFWHGFNAMSADEELTFLSVQVRNAVT